MMSSSNFQSTFSYALRRYKKRAKEDLLLHPLAARLQSCDSTPATLSVLQEKASNDERLMKWLSPAVNVLSALSSSLGDAGLVIIGVLFIPNVMIYLPILDIITCESHLRWHRCPTLSKCLP